MKHLKELKSTNLDKWISLKQTGVDVKVMNEILDNKITPRIDGYGVKKLLRNMPIKHKVCLNKITYGHVYELESSFKRIIAHSTFCVELRYEDGLMWPSRIVVVMAGDIINFFEQFLHETELKLHYCISCSSSRIALLTFKEITHEIVTE